MKPSRRTANRSGFTLVEAVLAAMIMGIALGACVLSFSMAMRTVSTAGNQMAVMHSCRNAVEALRTNHFSSVALQVGTNTFSNATFSCTYIVSNFNVNTKDVIVSMPYRNYIHGGFSTNTLSTSLTTTLHP